jgi:hypothetical protein
MKLASTPVFRKNYLIISDPAIARKRKNNPKNQEHKHASSGNSKDARRSRRKRRLSFNADLCTAVS